MITLNINVNHKYPEIEAMSAALDNITREVTEAKAGQAAAVVLIEGIRAQLNELAANATELADLKASLEQLSTDLSDSTDALGAAVAAPGTGEPTPDPAPADPDAQ